MVNPAQESCKSFFIILSTSSSTLFFPKGYMAKEKGVEIAEVVRGGPGLAFLVYPEVRSILQ
jgi:hypothetical protein